MFIQINPACISLPDRALPCIFDLEQKEIHKHYMFICLAAYSLATLKVGSCLKNTPLGMFPSGI